MTKKISTLLLLAVTALFSSCDKKTDTASTEKPVLKFSGIPDDDSTKLSKTFDPLAEILSKKLGIKIEFVPMKKYSASVAAFKNKQIGFAWFGGLTGVQARLAVPGAKAFAQGVEDPTYKSYFIANTNTGIEKSDTFPAEAFAGKTFTFGSKSSTSGRLMPEHFIRTIGKKGPEELFSTVGFSNKHNLTIKNVESGSYQVGAVSYTKWDSMVANKEVDTSKVKVVWTTPNYADYNWTMHPDLDKTYGEGFSEKLKQAILEIKDEAVLKGMGRSGFISADDAMFENIRKTAESLKLLAQ